ncbi:MAG: hypothetical protein AAGI37_12285 [Planctomycetota bacterium]
MSRWLIALVFACHATPATPGEDKAAAPPANPALADSTWPIYHANSYATAAVTAPTIDPDRVERVNNLARWRRVKGHVSPWTVARAPEADGSQVLLSTPFPGVAKYVIDADGLRAVHLLELDRKWTDFDWTIAVLANNSAIVTERKHNRYAIVADKTNRPDSPLEVVKRITIDEDRYGEISSHFTIAYDGTLIALTEKPMMIAVDLEAGRVKSAVDLKGVGVVFHNSYPVDEAGRVYLSTQVALSAFDWDGESLSLAWTSPYNMRGPGYEKNEEESKKLLPQAIAVARGEPGTGTGTTPTLLGDPSAGVIVLVDGHEPKNRLVAFFRGDIPEDHQPIKDPDDPSLTLDRRVAAVFPLPRSTPDGEGFTMENSPAAYGNSIVLAQWAGFKPDATPPTGVQRVDWDPGTRSFQLVWVNEDVLINGVPTIARTDKGLAAIGMGRDGNRYDYQVLDFETGQPQRPAIDLGTSDDALDQGNNHIITADGSIIYPGKKQLMRLYAEQGG